MKYNQKNNSVFEKVSNAIYLGLGLSLFSYSAYALYQNNIKLLFSNDKDKVKSIEKIAGNADEIESTKKNIYIVNEKEFREYLRK